MKGKNLTVKVNNVSSAEYKTQLEQFYPLLNKICFRYANNEAEYDELMSIAQEQLWNALNKFDKSKSKLITFIWNCVQKNVVQAKMKEIKRRKHFVPLDKLDGVLSDSHKPPENKIFVEQILDILELCEKKIMVDYYLKNMTLQEISNSMRISVCSVHKIKNRAIDKIRGRFDV